MGKIRKPFKNDHDLIKAAIRRSETSQAHTIACSVSCLERFVLIMNGRKVVSNQWAAEAFRLDGKRMDHGSWDQARLIWTFPKAHMEKICSITPNVEQVMFDPTVHRN